MNIEHARFNMIEQQIRTWDVLDQDVLSLLAVVRREDFVPPAHAALAFADVEVPLPVTTGEPQWMLTPKVEARLLQELAVRRHERVLEVGAGSGYMAALLGHRAQDVVTLEIDAELAAFARRNLERAGAGNVSVRHGDGSRGLSAEGPFDVVVLSGSVPDVPLEVLGQLRVGGRLVAIVGDLPIMRARLYTCSGIGDFHSVDLFDTVAPRLSGFDERTRFVF